jgi:hypothetical protein
MATEAQINANRRNARKSTGPRSATGKVASSRNGLSHGLSARKHLVDGDPEEYGDLLKDHSNRFHPVGDDEEELVRRIAAAQLRLDSAPSIEAGILENESVPFTSLVQLARYETTLERSIDRYLYQIETCQSARKLPQNQRIAKRTQKRRIAHVPEPGTSI